MPRIDRFLTAMKQHGADAVRLGAGKPVRLARGGILQSVTKDALAESQVTALLKEIAAPGVAAQIGPEARLTFVYESPIGPIEVSLAPEEGGFGATLKPTGGGAASAAVPVA
ncbi:MAG: hypothetical protein HOP28_08475, partial [Gemmatimonadales bacterium]|nr:hypothetical protein [Gemmatimonadales bacterium]